MAVNMKVVRDSDGMSMPPLDSEEGTAFGWFDRWQVGMTADGKLLTDYADWEARDLFDMLKKDYKAKQIDAVLTLPVMSAEYSIVPSKGDSGEAQFLNDYWNTDPLQGGCRTSLYQIIGLCTSAFLYKRAYFEKVWTRGVGEFEGKIVYSDVAFRPQTTCRIMREPKSGRYAGFEQEAYYLGPEISKSEHWPIQIPPQRAFVYTHGTRRDPLNGVSDLEVAFWAWKTKQKVLLLWFQFLQSVALPRITVKANDGETARNIAGQISKMKGSGVLPVAVPGGPNSVGIDLLDASGKGADQFASVIQWLDGCSTQSVLAGFLDLTGVAAARANAGRGGSYALSSDASDFFLQALEAKTRELEDQIRNELFAPLIFHNFGPNAAVPRLQFEPLNDIDKATAVDLLKSAMAAPPGGPVPTEFIAGLAEQVSDYIGLDGQAMKEAFTESVNAAAAQAKAEALAKMPGGGVLTGQNTAGDVGAVGGAINHMMGAVAAARPNDTKFALQSPNGVTNSAKQFMGSLLAQHVEAATQAKSGGKASVQTVIGGKQVKSAPRLKQRPVAVVASGGGGGGGGSATQPS